MITIVLHLWIMMGSLLYLFCYLVFPFAVSTNVAIEQKLERQIMKDLQFKCINYIFQNEKDIKEKFGSNIFANYVTVIFLPKDKGNIRKNKFGYFYVTAKSIMEGYQQVNSLGWEMAEMLAVTNKAILMEL